MTNRKDIVGRSVVSKAAVILLCFRDGMSHSLTEVVDVTGLPRSTAYRLICELVTWRLLERADDCGYRLGLPLRLIGTCSTDARYDLHSCAPVVLQDLCEVLDAEVRLGVLHNHGVAYVEKLPGARPASDLGSAVMLPAHATAMGKVLQAFSPPETVEAVIRRGLRSYTPFTLTAPDRLRRALMRTRSERLAVSRWELQHGRSAVAVPVYAPTGAVTAAIEVRVENLAVELPVVRPALFTAGQRLTRELCSVSTHRSVV